MRIETRTRRSRCVTDLKVAIIRHCLHKSYIIQRCYRSVNRAPAYCAHFRLLRTKGNKSPKSDPKALFGGLYRTLGPLSLAAVLPEKI